MESGLLSAAEPYELVRIRRIVGQIRGENAGSRGVVPRASAVERATTTRRSSIKLAHSLGGVP